MNAHIPYSSPTPTGLGVTRLFQAKLGSRVKLRLHQIRCREETLRGCVAEAYPAMWFDWRQLSGELNPTQQSLAVAGLREEIY